jgi:hypothetical protein
MAAIIRDFSHAGHAGRMTVHPISEKAIWLY